MEDPVAKKSSDEGTVQSKDRAGVPTGLTIERKPQKETLAEAETVQSADPAGVPAGLTVQTKPEVETSAETESADPPKLKDDGVEASVPVEGSCEVGPPEEATAETSTDQPVEQIESIAEVVVKSSLETAGMTTAAPGEESALPEPVEPVIEVQADSISEPPSQPAAVNAAQSSDVESDAQRKLLGTATEDVYTPETAVDHGVEPNVEGAVEPATVSPAEAALSQVHERTIELEEALNVEASMPEAVHEAVQDAKQSHTEGLILKQQSDNGNM